MTIEERNGVAALDNFRFEVNCNLATGALADLDLPVVNADGSHTVVAALEDEPLGVVLDRIAASGGSANLFVKREGGMRVAAVQLWEPEP